MSDSFVDLHSHSTASDGTLAPAEVARVAVRAGLAGWALTDHDTIGGVAEAGEESVRLGIDFLAGIEISAEYPHPGTMHILGYGVDPQNATLSDLTRQLIEGRDNRNPKIVKRLQELGVVISMEEVEKEAGGVVVGRPHIAAILQRKGYVSSIKEAFNKYLAPGGAAYFDKERLSPRRALEMIVESGGIPVLAHPVQLRCESDEKLEAVVRELMEMGLAGMEVMHSDHTSELVSKYTAMADRLGLLKSGGSDFHGGNKKDIELGYARGQRVPREFLDGLFERLRSGGVAKAVRE
ncbi:MAG TPA: PHP domain-containing protein [Tepidisphaeraceae bacterium]|nr:PHP domain-containing protein [Tepidisphaeraceae bacterium]